MAKASLGHFFPLINMIVLIWFDKGKDKTPFYFFLMEKKGELEKKGKLGNKSQEFLSREMFPIWNVSDGM